MYGYGFNSMMASIGKLAIGWGLAALLFWIFTASIRWKIFEKAGKEGWRSLIPFYGDYVEYCIIWEGKWYFVSLIALVAGSLLGGIPYLGPTIMMAGLVIGSVMRVVKSMQEAHAYGKDDGFAIGLMTFSFVFQFLIAYDSSIEYQGPQPTPPFWHV